MLGTKIVLAIFVLLHGITPARFWGGIGASILGLGGELGSGLIAYAAGEKGQNYDLFISKSLSGTVTQGGTATYVITYGNPLNTYTSGITIQDVYGPELTWGSVVSSNPSLAGATFTHNTGARTLTWSNVTLSGATTGQIVLQFAVSPTATGVNNAGSISGTCGPSCDVVVTSGSAIGGFQVKGPNYTPPANYNLKIDKQLGTCSTFNNPPATPNCNDGIDNDGDGTRDCGGGFPPLPADPQCRPGGICFPTNNETVGAGGAPCSPFTGSTDSGAVVPMIISFKNDSAVAVSNVAIADYFDYNLLQFSGIVSKSSNLGGLTNGIGKFGFTQGMTLAAGETGFFIAEFIVKGGYAQITKNDSKIGVITNNQMLGGLSSGNILISFETNTTDNRSGVQFTGTPFDLSITKSILSGSFTPGGIVTYRLLVGNSGSKPLNNITVWDFFQWTKIGYIGSPIYLGYSTNLSIGRPPLATGSIPSIQPGDLVNGATSHFFPVDSGDTQSYHLVWRDIFLTGGGTGYIDITFQLPDACDGGTFSGVNTGGITLNFNNTSKENPPIPLRDNGYSRFDLFQDTMEQDNTNNLSSAEGQFITTGCPGPGLGGPGGPYDIMCNSITADKTIVEPGDIVTLTINDSQIGNPRGVYRGVTIPSPLTYLGMTLPARWSRYGDLDFVKQTLVDYASVLDFAQISLKPTYNIPECQNLYPTTGILITLFSGFQNTFRTSFID
ncbi:MAG TPA: hypothetical protein PLW93_04190, partial [Candidatus Absconditabacterales bacterium]|nr:hypothetical protein [Candidatus Absconditabacterales bacterium]